MAVRVSQSMMFTNFVNNMNGSLSELMELNIQAASQKKINRPSDDPVGAARSIVFRGSIRSLGQYRENIDTAKGWLNLADETLMSVSTVLTRIKELSEQAATGTLTKDNRDQISYELRELHGQLINLANTQFEDRHIFGGHKYSDKAFQYALNLTSNDPSLLSNGAYSISGNADKTLLVQFLDTGTVGTDTLSYRYSKDGGDSWTTSTLNAGQTQLDLAGVRVDMQAGSQVLAADPTWPHETASSNGGALNGTWIWVRPTAEYLGDDTDVTEVYRMGQADVTPSAQGLFGRETLVRIDNSPSVDLDGRIEYSYSTDNGRSWVTGNVASNASSPTSADLLIPGGYLTLDAAGGSTLYEGDQFVVRPRSAKLEYEISPDDRIAVNNVGKDIFGGIYRDPSASNASAVFGGDERNVFETVGELLGYVETNNQSGIQRALEKLEGAQQQILTAAANVGARENRLDVAETVVEGLQINEKERLSVNEDVDIAELMTELAQKQIMYESVLKTSAQIMQLNLTNFI